MDDRQAKRRTAKPSHRCVKLSKACEALRGVSGHVVGKCESVCFELEARMDTFAAVLTILCHLSMYKFFLSLIKKDNLSM